MTSRELEDLVGRFPQKQNTSFYLKDAASIDRVQHAGFRAAVLRDLRLVRAGVPTT
jgi:hypothetical protein